MSEDKNGRFLHYAPRWVAEQVVVVGNGRVIERGTHEQLLAQGGFYHQLYMSQYQQQVFD
jgi:ABC-type transport system involved in cytochrome bd biosynthesis fused ATPase/permease subunit